jgi:hypothetical protein
MMITFEKAIQKSMTRLRRSVLWNGSPIHRGWAIKDSLASRASHWLQLEQLPLSTLRSSTPTKGSGSI